MKRILSAFKHEFRLQYRNGFFGAVGFVALLWIVVIALLPAIDWTRWLPFLVFSNLCITTYYFMAGLLLLDKTDGTLEALVVTPLRSSEFIGVRVLSLSLLALVENVLIIGLAIGWDSLPLTALPGILVCGMLYALFGYLTVLRYDSINSFMLPSLLFTVLLCLPVAPHFGWVAHHWHWTHPMGPGFVALEAGFWRQSLPLLVFSLGIGLVMCFGLFKLAIALHEQFVIQRTGDGA